MLGSSGRHTRRANSVAPEPGGGGDLDVRLDRAEAWYAARGRPAIFKLTSAAAPPELDEALAARGYTTDGETLGMTVSIKHVVTSEPSFAAQGAVTDLFSGRIDERWFNASCVLSGIGAAQHADYRAILERCVESQTAALFCSVEREGAIVSVAMGSVVEDAVSLVAVATADAQRGKGLAESVLRAILFAAREHGADRGLLNVEAPNQSARRLYERMGFVERYRYWYREAPAAPLGA